MTVTAPSVAPAAAHLPLAALLETQFRLLSFDIRRPDGNLLLELGFTRSRPPSGRLGASQYTLAGQPTVRLWGFGLLLRPRDEPHGCMLLRSGRALLSRRPDPPGVWDPMRAAAQLALGGPCPPPLLRDAIGWLATYERRLLAGGGPGVAHRADARARCEHHCPTHDTLAAQWDRWIAAQPAAPPRPTNPVRPAREPARANGGAGGGT